MKRCIVLMFLFFVLSACISSHNRAGGSHMVLTLKYPGAENVVLFCSFDGFKPRRAEKKSNVWASVVPAGKTFRYFYRVDDTLFVPDCQMKEKDDFGFENCIYDPHL